MNLYIRQFDSVELTDSLDQNASSKPTETIILLHGMFGRSDNLTRLGRALAQHYRVFGIDLPGHGQSAESIFDDIPSMAQRVLDGLLDLMQEQDLETVSLLGHSLGGKVAMQIAELMPEKINKLIIADIAPVKYPAHHLKILDALQNVQDQHVNSRKVADEILAEKVSMLAVRQYLIKSLIRDEQGNFDWQFNLARLKSTYEKLTHAPTLTGKFKKPILFLDGAESNFITADNRQSIYDHYPHAEVVTIEKAGHWLHADQPDVVFNTALQFLQTNQQS